MMTAEQVHDLRLELLEIGCHENGDARCTCLIGGDALDLIDAQAARIEALEAENAELRGLLWYAWSEFNAIRARSGAPLSRDGMLLCDDGYWSLLTDKFAAAIGDKDLNPWPSEDARAALAQGEER